MDGETAELRPSLSSGQRLDDIEIMITNVAGGMADIAAASGEDIDRADLALGEDIADRYHALWEVFHSKCLAEDGLRNSVSKKSR